LHGAERAQARCFLWRFLAASFALPDETTWRWMQDAQTYRLLERAQTEISPALREPLHDLIPRLLAPRTLAQAQEAHWNVFGHTVRGDCPPHEIEYGELKADWLIQPHRLADIAAFYCAFGLEVPDDADERVDHVAMECEFFSVLCAKEAEALPEGSQEHIEVCRDAQKKFLREHLGRWTPSFSRRLERLTTDKLLQSLAVFLRATVILECERFGIAAGNEDIKLRPADDMVDPCGKCGIEGLKPETANA
jgi:TorA maturation chaperone TorD